MAVQDDIIQNIVLGGVQDVVSGFQSIQRAGTTAFNAISQAATGSTSAIGGMATVIGGAAAAIGIASVGMFAWVKSSSQGVIAMGNFAEETGTSIEELSTFSTALSRVGSDTGNLTNAIRRLAVRVETDWGIIKKSISEAAIVARRDMLNVAQASLGLEVADRALARSEQDAANERKRASVNVKEAIINLKEAKAARDGITAADRRDLDQQKKKLAVEEAQQQLREARQRKANQADEEEAKLEQAAIDREIKSLQLQEARQKQSEDQKNSIQELKKFIDDLASGAPADFSKVNVTMDNMIRGIIASVGLAGNSLQDFKGSIADAAGAGPELFPVMEKIADVFHNLQDEGLKTALAVALFGRGVDPTLIHALSKGSEPLREMRQRMKDLGLVIDDTQVKIARDFRGALGRLRTDIDIISKQFSNQFAPAFTTLLDSISSGFEKARPAIIEFGAGLATKVESVVKDVVQAISEPGDIKADWINTLINLIAQLGPAFSTAASIIGGAVGIISEAFTILAGSINLIFGTDWGAGNAAAAAVAFFLLATAARALIGALIIAPILTFAGAIGTLAAAALAALPAMAGLVTGFGAVLLTVRAVNNFLSRREFEKSLESIQKQMKEGGASAEDIADTTAKMWKNFGDSQKGVVDDLKSMWDTLKDVSSGFVESAKKSAEEASKQHEENAKKTIESWRKAGEESGKKFEENIKKGADKSAADAQKAAQQIENALTGAFNRVGAAASNAARSDSTIQIKRVGDTKAYFDALKTLAAEQEKLNQLRKEGASKEDIAVQEAVVKQATRAVTKARENLGDISNSIRDITSKDASDSVRTLKTTQDKLRGTRDLNSAMGAKNRTLTEQNKLESDPTGKKATDEKKKEVEKLTDATDRLGDAYAANSKNQRKMTDEEKVHWKDMIDDLKKGAESSLQVFVNNTKATKAEVEHVIKDLQKQLEAGKVPLPTPGAEGTVDIRKKEVEAEKKKQDDITETSKQGLEIRRQQEKVAAQESLADEKKFVENFIKTLERVSKEGTLQQKADARQELELQRQRLKEIQDFEKAKTGEEKKGADDRIKQQQEAITRQDNLSIPKKTQAQEAADRQRLEDTAAAAKREREAADESARLVELGRLADEGRGKIDQLNAAPLNILPQNIKKLNEAAEGLEPALNKSIKRFEELQDDFRQPIKPKIDTDVLDIIKEKIQQIEDAKEKLEEVPLPKARPPGALQGDQPLTLDPEQFRSDVDDIENQFKQLASAARDTVSDVESEFSGANIVIPPVQAPQVDFSPVVSAAQNAGTEAGQALTSGMQSSITAVDLSGIVSGIQAVIDSFGAVGTAAENAKSAIQDIGTADFAGGIVSQASEAESALSGLVTAAEMASSAIDAVDSGGSSGSSDTGFENFPGSARGGLFRGRGGVDQNLIRVSDFEYVMRPEAVRKYGVGLLDLINSLQFRGFRAGGLIRVPSFATGGSVGRGGGGAQQPSRTMNITIGGQTFKGLIAPEETAKQLERAAVNRQYRTTGQKPRWVR